MNNWLESTTGRTRAWWILKIEELIKENTLQPANRDEWQTDTIWILELLDTINFLAPSDLINKTPWAASVLSVVLGAWYAHLQVMTTQNPQHSIALRELTQFQYALWQGGIQDATTILQFQEFKELHGQIVPSA